MTRGQCLKYLEPYLKAPEKASSWRDTPLRYREQNKWYWKGFTHALYEAIGIVMALEPKEAEEVLSKIHRRAQQQVELGEQANDT